MLRAIILCALVALAVRLTLRWWLIALIIHYVTT